MLINKFSFQLVVQKANTLPNYYSFKEASFLNEEGFFVTDVDLQENYKRKVFPFEQLFNWLKTELCKCERCSLVLRCNMSSGAL